MIGTRLKELREGGHLTQSQFAEEMNVSQQAVGKWERDLASPNDEMLKKIDYFKNLSYDEKVKIFSEISLKRVQMYDENGKNVFKS